MINAGVKIPAAQPDMDWNDSSKEWENIIIEVVYIQPQNITDNPVLSGDILIDQSPRVYEVISSTHYVGSKFKVNVKCISEPTTTTTIPLPNTQRGAICTPNPNGYIAPYWNGTVVELAPFRMSMIYNFNINPPLTSTGSGASSFLQLSDTPNNYNLVGTSLVVNSDRSGLVFSDISGGGSSETCQVSISSGENGTIFPSGQFQVMKQSNLTIQISPDPGYEIDTITVGSNSVTPIGTYTITNIVNDKTVYVDFKEDPDGTGSAISSFGLVDIDRSEQIALGYNHLITLSTDGKVYVSGDNTFGQLGFGGTTSLSMYGVGVNSLETISYDPPASFYKVFAGYNSSAAIDMNGNVYVWGENNFKKFGSSLDDVILSPHKLDLSFACKQVAIGPSYTVLVGTNNKMYFCGFYSAHTQDIKFDNYIEVIAPGDIYGVEVSTSQIWAKGSFRLDGNIKHVIVYYLTSPITNLSNLCRYSTFPNLDDGLTTPNVIIDSIPLDPTNYTNNGIFEPPRNDIYMTKSSPMTEITYHGNYPPPPGKVSSQTFPVYNTQMGTTGRRIIKFSVGEGLVLILLIQPNSSLGGDTFSGRVFVGESRINNETNSRQGLIPMSVDGEGGGILTVNGSYIENIKNVISYYNRGIIVRPNGAMQMIYRKSLFEPLTMKYIT